MATPPTASSSFNLQFLLGIPSFLLLILGSSSLFIKTPSISLEGGGRSTFLPLPLTPTAGAMYDLTENPIAIAIRVPLEGESGGGGGGGNHHHLHHHYHNKHKKRLWNNGMFEEPTRYSLLKVPLINNQKMISKLRTVGISSSNNNTDNSDNNKNNNNKNTDNIITSGSWIPPPLQRIIFRWWQWLEGDLVRFSRIYSELPVDICIQVSQRIYNDGGHSGVVDVDWTSSPVLRDVEQYRLSAVFQELHGGEFCYIRVWTEWGAGVVRPDLVVKDHSSRINVVFEKAPLSGMLPLSMLKIACTTLLLVLICSFTLLPWISGFMERSIMPLVALP